MHSFRRVGDLRLFNEQKLTYLPNIIKDRLDIFGHNPILDIQLIFKMSLEHKIRGTKGKEKKVVLMIFVYF